MPKLKVDDIGAYIIAGQMRDPQGAMMVQHFAPQTQDEIEVTDGQLEALIAQKMINILEGIKQLKQGGLLLDDQIFDQNLRRAIFSVTSSQSPKIYLQYHQNIPYQIRQGEIFGELAKLSVLADELPFGLKNKYNQIDWHKLKELQEILIQNGVKDGNYERSKGLLKSFFNDLNVGDLDQMIRAFRCVDNRQELDTADLAGFHKINAIVGYYEDRNFIADIGFRPNQQLTSKIDFVARVDIEDRCCTTIAGRLSILRFLAFAGENRDKFTNGEIRAMLPESLYAIRNRFLDHITIEKIQKSLIPLVSNPEHEVTFRNLFKLCNKIAHTLKELDLAGEMELLTLTEPASEYVWQRIKERTSKTGGSLDSKAIDDFFEVEKLMRYQPLMDQERFLNFKEQLVATLGLESENRIYSKGEEKKMKKGQSLDLKTFDQMINEWQAKYNKGENLFEEGSIEGLWQICAKFECTNVNKQNLRSTIGNLISDLKSELSPPQPTSLETLFATLQFTGNAFGKDCRLAEIDSDQTLPQIVRAGFTDYQPPEDNVNQWANKIRGNYRQRIRAVESRIDELVKSFIKDPEKLHAAELMIGMIDDLASQVERSPDFAALGNLGYGVSGSKTIRNRIDHQQSTYREHDVESESSFSSTYINDHAKSTAQTLLFMMINLRGVVNEALHNPQTRQTQIQFGL
jgi:hypothetical protein